MSSRRPALRPKPSSAPHRNPPALLTRGRVICLGLLLILCLAGAVEGWLWTRPGPAHERRGLAALAQGRPAEAEQEWRQGIQEDPRALGCYAQLGDLYLAQKRFSEAAAAYTAAVHLAPTDGTLFLRLNRAALAAGDVPGAEAAAKRAADLRPEDPDAVGLYGLLENRQNNPAAALAALRRAHTLRPSDRDYLLELVNLEIQAVALGPAEQDLTPYLQTHPTDAWACHLMGVIWELKSHTPAGWQTALAYEQRAQAGLPDDPRVCLTLGDLYLSLDRPAESRAAFQAGRKLLPNSEAMLHGLVQADSRLGDRKAAAAVAAALQTLAARHQRISFLRERMTLDPADVASGLALARLEEEEGEDGASRGLLTGLLRRAPRDPRLHRALADFYLRHHRPDLASRAARLDDAP